IDPGFGIEAFVLSAEGVEAMAASQTGWMPGETTPLDGRAAGDGAPVLRLDEDVLALVDRLANRFGTQVAYQIEPEPSHVPERAARLVAAGSASAALSWDDWQQEAPHTAPRPQRLLDRPEPADVVAAVPDGPPAHLVWRRVRRGIVRARGPERIAAPWWQDRHPDAFEQAGTRVRDYYDVEDEEGRRYWVFRAGLYGQEGPDGQSRPPQWFVHGLFQ
ncbi:MAG: hypothetical protein KI785_00360, partial [Devosiaceae bacterium]|nr:hypothetical protein [Devosiaceae bacterium MH13]